MPTKINQSPQDLIAMLTLRRKGLTYATIGQKYGTSRQRIHQLLSQITDSDRAKVWQRSDGCCEICGKPATQCLYSLTYHHKQPIIEGYNQPDNLLLLCQTCHRHIHKGSTSQRYAGVWIAEVSHRRAVLTAAFLHMSIKEFIEDAIAAFIESDQEMAAFVAAGLEANSRRDAPVIGKIDEKTA